MKKINKKFKEPPQKKHLGKSLRTNWIFITFEKSI